MRQEAAPEILVRATRHALALPAIRQAGLDQDLAAATAALAVGQPPFLLVAISIATDLFPGSPLRAAGSLLGRVQVSEL